MARLWSRRRRRSPPRRPAEPEPRPSSPVASGVTGGLDDGHRRGRRTGPVRRSARSGGDELAGRRAIHTQVLAELTRGVEGGIGPIRGTAPGNRRQRAARAACWAPATAWSATGHGHGGRRGGGDRTAITVARFAGLLAGALSMALGEWLSVQSARGLLPPTRSRPSPGRSRSSRGGEEELRLIYEAKGVPPEAQDARTGSSPAAVPSLSPPWLGRSSGSIPMSWAARHGWRQARPLPCSPLGAIVPVIPYLFLTGTPAIIVSMITAGVALFGVGAAITLVTGRGSSGPACVSWHSARRRLPSPSGSGRSSERQSSWPRCVIPGDAGRARHWATERAAERRLESRRSRRRTWSRLWSYLGLPLDQRSGPGEPGMRPRRMTGAMNNQTTFIAGRSSKSVTVASKSHP